MKSTEVMKVGGLRESSWQIPLNAVVGSSSVSWWKLVEASTPTTTTAAVSGSLFTSMDTPWK